MTALMTSKSAPSRKPRRWEWSKGAHESAKITIPALLWTLHEMGGKIEDRPTGRCSVMLIDAAKAKGFVIHRNHDPNTRGAKSSSLSSLMKELESGRYAGCITRELNGKRTSQIVLNLTEPELPPRPFPVVVKRAESTPVEPTARFSPFRRPEIGDTRPVSPRQQPAFSPTAPAAPAAQRPNEGGTKAEPDLQPPADQVQPEPELTVVAEPEPVEIVEPTIPPLIPIDGDPVALLLQIQQLSMSAVMAVAAGMGEHHEDGEGDKVERDERLAATLAENDRLRRKVNDHAETINAKVKEIGALRKALTTAQGNLKAIQENANNAATTERNLARLKGNQRFISERPEAAIAGRRGA